MFFVMTCPEAPFEGPELFGPFPTWEAADAWRDEFMPKRVTTVAEPERTCGCGVSLRDFCQF